MKDPCYNRFNHISLRQDGGWYQVWGAYFRIMPSQALGLISGSLYTLHFSMKFDLLGQIIKQERIECIFQAILWMSGAKLSREIVYKTNIKSCSVHISETQGEIQNFGRGRNSLLPLGRTERGRRKGRKKWAENNERIFKFWTWEGAPDTARGTYLEKWSNSFWGLIGLIKMSLRWRCQATKYFT